MVNKALRVRIYPNKTQQKKIDTTINCCRFVRNHMIERNRKLYDRRKKHLNYVTMANLLPGMKKYLPWLAEADAKALQYACHQVDNAYQRFFKKQGGYPKFQSKRDTIQSYTNTNSNTIHYETGRVKIPCVGWVKTRDERMLPQNSKICFVTVICDHGQYFASICYKIDKVIAFKQIDENNAVGLDYKSDGLYTDSNGNCCDMPHYYRDAQEAVIKEQRKLSRKVGNRKGEKRSGNYIRQQRHLFKKTRHIANQRKDFLHKQSRQITNVYDCVCVENLDMKAMSQALNFGKSVSDNGWGMFVTYLKYKLEERGKILVKVDKFFASSQTCSCCGYVNKETKSLAIRAWDCPQCGVHHDRDVNAAINIRNEGMRIALA